jgi:hypothetical protein
LAESKAVAKKKDITVNFLWGVKIMDNPWPSLECSFYELDQYPFQPKYNYLSLAIHLQNLGGMLVSTSPGKRRELIAKFHDCAGKIPYAADCDIGALVLEDLAETANDSKVKCWLYQESQFRAKWCVESGTSGGECNARSRHLERINKKIKDLEDGSK